MVACIPRSIRRTAAALASTLILATATAARADDLSPLRHYARQTWQTADGLPQNSVRAIVQTREGYLWFATAEGLVRFDGVRFTVYDRTSTPALPVANIASLAEAADGSLWIGLRRYGLARLHEGAVTTWTTAQGLSGSELLSMTATPDGSVWAGAAGHGLNRIRDGKVTIYRREEGLPDNDVFALTPAAGGGVLAGTGAGAVLVSDAGIRPLTPIDTVNKSSIGALLEGHEHDVWLGTQEGLLHLQHGQVTRYTRADGLPADDVVALARGAGGAIWVGMRSGGVARFRDGRFDTYTGANGLPDEFVHALYEDHERNLWVGTSVGGVTRLRDTPFRWIAKRDGLPADVIRAVYESRDGSMWVATNGYGLARVSNGAVTRWTSDTGLPSDGVSTIGETRDGAMWIGTRNGLVRMRGRALTHYTTAEGLPHDNVRSFFEDRDGGVWIGTMGGVCRLEGARCVAVAGLTAHVRAFHQSADGALWVATHRGLFRYHDGSVTHWGAREGLSSETLTSIVADADGALWLSTSGGGLNRLKDGRISSWRSAQGLHDDTIFRVLADGRGWLWMTSNRGLFRVSRAALEAVSAGRARMVQPQVYTEVDGLPSAEFNGGSFPAGVLARDGRLWLPSVKGVVLVDPARVAPAAAPPPVVIERVTANGRLVSLREPATVGPGDGKLEIQYTAFRFVAPSRLRFRFKLEGFDTDWVDVGSRRTAYYTNVPPGSYVFRVLASDGSGGWGSADATYAITLTPRFYQTRGFLALMIASGALLVVGAVHLRSARQRAQERRLRGMVDARTRELQDEVAERKRAEAALVDAREAAIEASRLKSEFLANMSHEIRTPMNGVIGMTDLALEHALEPRVREYLQTVRSSADALLHVINDILDFAKIEAGKLDLAAIDFDLRQLVTDVVTLLGPRARDKGLVFSCDLPSSLPPRLVGDPLRLRQVLTNLVGNALKFTDSGDVRVEVSAVAAPDAGRPIGLRFAVTDTGIGIAESDRARIFDAFTQADGSSTRRFGGTGLGLAISAQLVQLMGGRLEVASELGRGSTFSFVISFVVAEAPAVTPERTRIVPAGRRLSVLVAEDNPVNQLLTQRLLEKAGHTVTMVDTGAAALDALTRATFDVVLMDVQMPEMNGFEATRGIRESEGAVGRRIPIIALTAHAMRGDRERCLDAGMDGYVTKPIRADDLYSVLADIVCARDAA
jgi:signal transduction histidine kinase/ligand-binding sensor domain-containing protein/ActR/RegA family two-component response regulator